MQIVVNFWIATMCLFCVNSFATEESPHQFSANLTLVSDYLYRGISQTNGHPAMQGGFDYAHKSTGLYAGLWTSNIDFAESLEIDIYGGISGELANGFGWDIGGLYYLYPGSDIAPEKDFVETYASASYALSVQFDPEISVGIAWSPDFFGETGNAIYLNGGLDVSLYYGVGLSFYLGWQDVDRIGNYIHYNIGLSKDVGPVSLGLSWNDANDNCLSFGAKCDAFLVSIGTNF